MSPTIIGQAPGAFLGATLRGVWRSMASPLQALADGSWEPQDYGLWGLSNWNEGEITLETLCRSSETPYAIVHCAGWSVRACGPCRTPLPISSEPCGRL